MKRPILLTLAIMLTCLISEGRQPQRGYRGFLDWSSSVRSEIFGFSDINGNILAGGRESTFYTGFSTSHGYQIDPMFFAGAGLGMERCGKLDNWVAPLFAEGRIDLKFGNFTPFGDLRLGVNIAEGMGVYFSPTVGYRFNWGRRTGVNVGLGLTLAGYRAEHFELTYESPDSYQIYYVGTRHHVRPYFSFRVGIDF